MLEMRNLASRPQKVLIIHTGGIGDLLLALPCLRIFRRNFPQSDLELMGRPERLSLISFDLHAQAIHSVDQAGMAFFYTDHTSLPPRLSGFFSSFDIAFVFGKPDGNVLSENLKKAGLDRVIFIPPFPSEDLGIHVSEYLVECLKSSGIQGEFFFSPLRLPQDVLDFAESFLVELGLKKEDWLLTIHPGSGSPAKNWKKENFARIAEWASERSKILLISGPAEGGIKEIQGAMPKAKVFAVKNLSLIQLAAVLQSSTVYLGNDSGITHLAAALGLPTIAIFGPTNPEIWGPRGPGVRILYEKNFCSPCSSEERTACSRQCLESIRPNSVIKLLSPFFK